MCCHLTMNTSVVLHDSDSLYAVIQKIRMKIYNPGAEHQSLNNCAFNRIAYSMISPSYTIFFPSNTSFVCCCFDIFMVKGKGKER